MRARATTDTAKLTRVADRLWQEVVCHDGVCAHCGAPVYAGHHLIRRSHKGTRWSLMNGLPLCAMCHGDIHGGHWDEIEWLKITDPDRFWFYHSHKNAQPVQMKAFMIRETIEQLKALKEVL